MNVSLAPKWEEFVAQKLRSGCFQSVEEVVAEGLRLLQQQERLKSVTVGSIQELEEKVHAGLRSLASGKGIDAQDALKEIRSEIQAKAERA